MKKRKLVRLRFLFLALLGATAGLAYMTWLSLEEPPSLAQAASFGGKSRRPLVLDRFGQPIRVTFQNQWNFHEQKLLHDVPALLREAVVFEEDHRFYDHAGVDWLARAGATLGNLRKMSAYRGASTITEQVVRMLNPRPRSLWAKWVEGWEAMWLETKNTKSQILEFYLNQVPYSHQRRGVAQAARLYFDRDLSTLNEKEMLTLAAMIKSPTRLDPRKRLDVIEKSVERLAARMHTKDLLSRDQLQFLQETPLELATSDLSIEAPHFINFLEKRSPDFGTRPVERTTLHPEWQRYAQRLLDENLTKMRAFKVENGAIVVVDHETDEILVWAVAQAQGSGKFFNAPLVPRQPGSSLKPFLYALALEGNVTPATLIRDEPLATAVGTGSHEFHNYSRIHYGDVTVREALANSLNVPAIKIIKEVGTGPFMRKLTEMGIESLRGSDDFYGEGLALGNGEISLLEMMNAYSTLARGGTWRPLKAQLDGSYAPAPRSVFSPEAAALIGNILSDAHARRLEFGSSGIMDFPVQTAIKTGTSTDYRDAWVFAYNYRYVVGVWMGNLSYESTEGLTGASGPVIVARSMMAKLNENAVTKPLSLSPKLVRRQICKASGRILPASGKCQSFSEYFIEGTDAPFKPRKPAAIAFNIVKPTQGLSMAMDPRVPKKLQAYEFEVEGVKAGLPVRWYLNGKLIRETKKPKFTWSLEKGVHRLKAVQGKGKLTAESERKFIVK